MTPRIWYIFYIALLTISAGYAHEAVQTVDNGLLLKSLMSPLTEPGTKGPSGEEASPEIRRRVEPFERKIQENSNQKITTSADVETKKSEFYRDYMAKVYPKALVVRRWHFEQKPVQEVIQALADVIDVIATLPWFYVANDNKGFKIRRNWEFFDDQLFIFEDYFRTAFVNKATGKVFTRDIFAMLGIGRSKKYFEFKKNNQKISEYFAQHNITILKDFYALRFDFTLKFFNEYILFKELKLAKKFFEKLGKLARELDGSVYEKRYCDALTFARQLLSGLEEENVYNVTQDKKTFLDRYGN